MYISEDTIKRMAVELIQEGVSFQVDMMMDMPEDYKTYDDVAKVMNNAQEVVGDVMLDDVLMFITERLTHYVKTAKVVVQEVSIGKEGFISADYKLEMAEK